MADNLLLEAVRNLTAVVTRLERTLEEYPKRSEVERRFLNKREGVKRRRQLFAIMCVFGLVALLFSFLTTTGTVSACFLSLEARKGQPPSYCNLIPNFEESQREQEKIREQFQMLLEIPKKNDRRLDRIEVQLGIQ